MKMISLACAGVFLALLALNLYKLKSNDTKYKRMTEFIQIKNQSIIPGKRYLAAKEEMYKASDFFKMRNSGKNKEELIMKLWRMAITAAEAMQLKDPFIQIKENNKKKFEEIFNQYYKKITEQYMAEDNEALDRHKVASIYMISIIQSQIMVAPDNTEEKFMGIYVLATDCGLVYMLQDLNEKLSKLGEKQIDQYYFPSAMACETEYYRIFYRNLSYIDKDEEFRFNPLDMADRLFLIEYLTLKENGINPDILKEY